MVVQKQLVNVPLAVSLDTKTDPKMQAPSFLLLENAIRHRSGEIRKRFGYVNQPFTMGTYPARDPGPNIASAQNYQLLQFENESALISRGVSDGVKSSQYIYRQYNGKWNSYAQSRISEIVTVESRSISQNPLYNVQFVDSDIAGDVVCTAYSRTELAPGATSNVYFSLYSLTDDTNLKTDVLISGNVNPSYKPRVVANTSAGNNHFHIFFLDATATALRMVVIDATTGAISTTYTIATNCYVPFGGFFSECVSLQNGNVVVAYTREAGGNPRVSFKSVTITGTVVNTYDEDTYNVYRTIALQYDAVNQKLYCAFGMSSNIAGIVMNLNLTVATAIVQTGLISQPFSIAMSVLANEIRLYFSTSERTFEVITTLAFVTTQVATAIINSVGLATTSIPSNYKDGSFVGAQDFLVANVNAPGAGSKAGTLFYSTELKAKISKDVAGIDYMTNNPNSGFLPSIVRYGTKLIAPVRVAVSSVGDYFGNIICGVSLSVIETQPEYVQSVNVNGISVFGGGVVRCFDGQNTTELNWNTLPAPVEIGVVTTTGGNMAAGVYQYINIYEWIDSKGNLHRSGLSVPRTATVTGTTTSKVALQMHEYGITTRNTKNGYSNSHGRIVLYRTKKDGTIFYKHSEYELQSNDALSNPLISIEDTTGDGSLLNELLYTTGGILENESPPAAKIVNTFKNRIFIVSSEDGSVWYSNELVRNEAPTFSSILRIEVDRVGGEVTALAEMDDKIIFFKNNTIFYTVGDGANAAGIGGYNPPSQLPSEIGCIDARSVAKIADGIIFKSERGFYLLDRGMNLSYIGEKISLYNNAKITSCVSFPSLTQTRFTTSNGYTLVFESLYKEWYVWKNLGATSAALHDGRYTVLKSTKEVWREFDTVFSDDGQAVIRRLITAPIQIADIQGFQRIFSVTLLGEYRGAHTVKAFIAYDNKEYFEEEFSLTPTSTVLFNDSTYQSTSYIPGGTVDNVWQFELRPRRQVCTNFRLMIEDNFVDVPLPADSFTFSAMAFSIGVLGGRNRLPKTKIMD